MGHASDPNGGSAVQHWGDIFLRYRKALARIVSRIVKPHEIEDIVQETYLRIYQASQQRSIRSPKSFMLKAARNVALNHAMRADAMNHLDCSSQEIEFHCEADGFLETAQSSVSTETLVQAEEEFLLFCRAVRELPLQCRRAFILKKVYGLSQKEVAQRLGIGESTVEKHVAKGIVACSAYLRSHGYTRLDERAAGDSSLVSRAKAR